MIKLATMFTGGLSAVEFALKYEELEYEHIIGAEWDKYARKQCIHFHGEAKDFHQDVSKFNGVDYRDKTDLLVWGSSCQNFSLAGNRKGLEGNASKYFIDGLERQKEMMPKTFIFENVKGMLSSNNGKDFKYAINAFREMGYYIAYKVVNTKEHGIPQNRERVFIVGFLDADQYHNFTFEDAQPLKLRLRDMLEESVDNKYYLSDKVIQGNLIHKERHENRGNGFAFEPKTEDDISGCLSTKYGNRQTDTYLKVKSATSCGYETATENDSINFTHPDSKTRRGRVGKGVAQTLDCACNQGVIEPKIVAMRGRNPDNHEVQDKYRIRRLTPIEVFRLQGVKDEDINLVVSSTQAYKIAGNAISVNVMQMILRQLYKPKPSGGLF